MQNFEYFCTEIILNPIIQEYCEKVRYKVKILIDLLVVICFVLLHLWMQLLLTLKFILRGSKAPLIPPLAMYNIVLTSAESSSAAIK